MLATGALRDDSPDAPHETREWLTHVVRFDPRGIRRLVPGDRNVAEAIVRIHSAVMTKALAAGSLLLSFRD